MNEKQDFEAALALEPERGLYRLNADLPADTLREIATNAGYVFYCIDGTTVTDHPSFFITLTQAFEWPQPGGGNWDAVFDVLTEPRYYEPQEKGIILFDQCHHLARSDPASFNIVADILKEIPPRFVRYLDHHSMKGREAFRIYTLLRGEDDAFRALPDEVLPLPTFLKS